VVPIQVPRCEAYGRSSGARRVFGHAVCGEGGTEDRSVERRTLGAASGLWLARNIRELQNVIERAVILCEGDTLSIDEAWLKPDVRGRSPRPSPPKGTLGRPDLAREKEVIEAALADSRGRVSGPSGAAAKLGVPRQTLESKIASLGIDRHRFRSA
jgi:formate hydrogenlyase transcriptional activator